ncbi:MAG: hypothetical protein HGA74_10320 [Deltaproteobacteria bacterium]|nr:hypothetical protein [Deltaproteobacteria bacterium]
MGIGVFVGVGVMVGVGVQSGVAVKVGRGVLVGAKVGVGSTARRSARLCGREHPNPPANKTAPAKRSMTNLFVMMREMALPAVAVNVLAVARLRCQRMAAHASDLCVRRLPKLSRVDKRNFLSGQSLRRLAFLSVTVKADRLDLFRCPAFLRANQPVAGHARLILR